MDVYCRVCGEPWDVWSLKEDFTESERKQFLEGKGCPACGGKTTYYCENCGEYFKAWMIRDFYDDYGELADEIVKSIWDDKKCPFCGTELKRVTFSKYGESLVENSGAIEDVLNVSVLDLL